MSSQASSAGGGEAKVRRKLVETGDVAIMIAHPLQFLLHPHRSLRALVPEPRQAPGTLRQGADDRRPQCVPQGHAQDIRLQPRAAAKPLWPLSGCIAARPTSFSTWYPTYCRRTLDHAAACFNPQAQNGQTPPALPDFTAALDALNEDLHPFLNTDDAALAGLRKELDATLTTISYRCPGVSARQRRSGA